MSGTNVAAVTSAVLLLARRLGVGLRAGQAPVARRRLTLGLTGPVRLARGGGAAEAMRVAGEGIRGRAERVCDHLYEAQHRPVDPGHDEMLRAFARAVFRSVCRAAC